MIPDGVILGLLDPFAGAPLADAAWSQVRDPLNVNPAIAQRRMIVNFHDGVGLDLSFLGTGPNVLEAWEDGPNAHRYGSDHRRVERSMPRGDC